MLWNVGVDQLVSFLGFGCRLSSTITASVRGHGVPPFCSRVQQHIPLGLVAPGEIVGSCSDEAYLHYIRWYGVGGTIQLAIFGMVAAKVKMNANGAHTFLEVRVYSIN